MKQVRALKYSLGRLCAVLFPQRRQLVIDNFTLPYFGNHLRMDRVDRLIRFYYAEKFRQNTTSELEQVHRSFWSKQRKEGWYDAARGRLHDLYIPAYGPAVDEVATQAERRNLTTFVEFGTGNGAWLSYVKGRMKTVERFIGVDIAEAQLAENRLRYPDLEFVCQDMVEWTRTHSSGNTIYHTNSGVFEYLSENSLRELLDAIKRNGRNTFLFLIEPVHLRYDLEEATESLALGSELSYSHNYPRLLREKGFDIISCDSNRIGDYNVLVLQASG